MGNVTSTSGSSNLNLNALRETRRSKIKEISQSTSGNGEGGVSPSQTRKIIDETELKRHSKGLSKGSEFLIFASDREEIGGISPVGQNRRRHSSSASSNASVEFNREFKVPFFGAGDGGKSTLLRQLHLLFSDKDPSREYLACQQSICFNVLSSVQKLCSACKGRRFMYNQERMPQEILTRLEKLLNLISAETMHLIDEILSKLPESIETHFAAVYR
jgi:hypothetical protein